MYREGRNMAIRSEPQNDIKERSMGFVHYYGRPEWLTDEILEELRAEARRRRGQASDVERQAHARVGACGSRFASSREMLRLIAVSVRPACPTGNANYLYYDSPGSGIDPHIDSVDFPLQVLLMIDHHGFTNQRSSLVIFPNGPRDPVPIVLDPGHLVLFDAASVYHGRTSVSPGERLVLLGAGYRAENPEADSCRSR
jgi:hypothetical protein